MRKVGFDCDTCSEENKCADKVEVKAGKEGERDDIGFEI